MSARPRIDLDGVTLLSAAPEGGILAIFRYRVKDGLLLLIPESAEVHVSWDVIAEARLDLAGGTLTLTFDSAWARLQPWLRGAVTVQGGWLDRMEMGG